MKLSEQVRTIRWAFGDPGRVKDILSLATAVEELEWIVDSYRSDNLLGLLRDEIEDEIGPGPLTARDDVHGLAVSIAVRLAKVLKEIGEPDPSTKTAQGAPVAKGTP